MVTVQENRMDKNERSAYGFLIVNAETTIGRSPNDETERLTDDGAEAIGPGFRSPTMKLPAIDLGTLLFKLDM